MDAPQSAQEPLVPGVLVADSTNNNDLVPTSAPAPPETAGEDDEAGPGPSSATLPPAADPPPDAEEEEDPLVVAQREQEEREKALEEALNIQAYDDVDMRVSKVKINFSKYSPLPTAIVVYFIFKLLTLIILREI